MDLDVQPNVFIYNLLTKRIPLNSPLGRKFGFIEQTQSLQLLTLKAE